MKKRMTFIGILLLTSYLALPSQACTRAVYLGPDNMVITGRTMVGKRFKIQYLSFSTRNKKSRSRQRQHDPLDLQIRECHHRRL